MPAIAAPIEIKALNVQFVTSNGTVHAVEELSYSGPPRRMVAIVRRGAPPSRSCPAVMSCGPPGTLTLPKGRSASKAASCCNCRTRSAPYPRPGDAMESQERWHVAQRCADAGCRSWALTNHLGVLRVRLAPGHASFLPLCATDRKAA